MTSVYMTTLKGYQADMTSINSFLNYTGP